MNKLLLLVFGCICYATGLLAQNTSDIVVPITVTTTNSPASITLSFPATANATNTLIGRKLINSLAWEFVQLAPNATTFTDSGVLPGIGFEYMVIKQTTTAPTQRIGLVYAGIEVLATAYRGKIILVVDNVLSSPLTMELDRLVQDLRGDGWQVIRRDISVAAHTVPTVKSLIRKIYNDDPDNTVGALLFGNIPVPYSGNINPDGHPDHLGAWPTDYYYGDMNETAWTDNLVNSTSASRPANRNIPGDGKFDQSATPTLAEIVVSRVDFSNLSGWDVSQTELYRRYLNKNHNFRTGAYKPGNKTLIDDNFGYFGGEAFAQNGWRNGNAITGVGSIIQGDFFNDTDNQNFLIGYGCGGGNYTGANGVGSSTNFQTDSVNIVFSMLFGSYFGDWDFETNPFMPSALASKGGILSCSWAGRPNWHLHTMGLGEPILTSTFWVWLNSFLQNPVYPPNFGDNLIHVGLLGDPTLRAHAVQPPENVVALASCDEVTLTWKASPDAALGYLVYRAPSPDSIFEPIVNAPVTATTYVDTMPLPGMNFYQVKSFKLEMVPTGSYYNQSIGTPASVNFMSAAAVPTAINCNGGNDGAIDLSVLGGLMGNFTYLWSNNSTTQNLSGLPAGTYTVTVTNQQGCTTTASATVTEPAALDLNTTPTNVLCFGANNGQIELIVQGGTPGYTHAWSNGSTTQNLTGLAPGSYTVTTTDANGCMETATDIVTEPQAIDLSLTPEDVACNGASTGNVNLNVSGGTPGYSYAWSNGANTQNLNNVPAGTYTIIVTDDNGCTKTGSATISQPTAINAATSVTNAGCAGATNGGIELEVSGGTPGYSFEWSDGSTGQNLSGVAAGTFTVTVTDNAGCSQTATATITEPSMITAGAQWQAVPCLTNIGNVTLNVSGGTPGYTFLWSNSATTPNLPNVPPGIFTVTITDLNGCTRTATNTIVQPAPVLAVGSSFIQTSCPGATPAIGNLYSDVAGGTPGYTYLWSNGATTANQTGVPAGAYTVTVTDANGCTKVHENMVYIFHLPWAVNSTVTNVLCHGGSTGAVALTVSGANGPNYTYQWSNGSTAKNILNVPAGAYTVTITDESGCTTTHSAQVGQPADITVDLQIENADCTNGYRGSINRGGGSPPPLVYLWSNGVTTLANENLAPGTYTLTITNSNGCTKLFEAVVELIPFSPQLPAISGNDTSCVNVPQSYSLPATFALYQWSASDSGAILQGQGTAQVEAVWPNTGPHTLTLVVTNDQDCRDTTELMVFTDICLGTATLVLPGVAIQPNPFNEHLTVRFDRPVQAGAQLRLLDLQGRLILENTALTESTRLETGHLPAGSYVLYIIENGRAGVWKVVKIE